MYDNLLPLFGGATQSNAVLNEVVFWPTQVFDNVTQQPISNAKVQDALYEERTDIEELCSMPKLDAPLSSCTCLGSHSADYLLDSYGLAIYMCEKEELVSFNEAQNSKNWMAAIVNGVSFRNPLSLIVYAT